MTDETTQTTPAEAEIEASQTTQPEGTIEAKFTQADLDRVLGDRLKRERNKWEKEFTARLEDEKKKASMEESERLRLELTEKSNQLNELQAKAAIAEAKAELLQAGVNPAKADKALRVYLAELEDLGEGEEAPSFEAFLNEWPEFKAQSNRPDPTKGASIQGAPRVYSGDMDKLAKENPDEFNRVWEAQLKRK